MSERRKTEGREGGLRYRLRNRPRLRPKVYGYLTEEKESLRQGFAALFISSTGNLVAGMVLGAITGTLEELVGLMVLIPAAIGMRGAIFGAMGSRLGTAIHTGLFEFNLRRGGVLRENVEVALVLSLTTGVILAFLARYLSGLLGVATDLSVLDYIVISTLGGLIAGVVVMVVTVLVAEVSVRRGWDLDNIAAPMVTASGDIITLPSIVAVTFFIGTPYLTEIVAAILVLLTGLAMYWGFRQGETGLRRILGESLPVLTFSGAVLILAGMTLETRLEAFVTLPALLVLIPAFLQQGGALGSILASRLSSKIHLGLLEPKSFPPLTTFRDFNLVYMFAVGVFVFVGSASHVLALVTGYESPGLALMIIVSLFGGLIATTTAIVVAYYSSIGTYRFGLDPDNHSIPIITATMDLVGVFSLIISLIIFGLAG
ncbi:MAG: magnesium transporter [Actinomycetota bacterium]|nr:magnesium transporter [Actinomycetota bacterium]HZY64639.1 magnesium transporter [Rubrobacteraceae bacterium]